MCGCCGDHKCATHFVPITETCDTCLGQRFITATIVMGGMAYPREYPCGPCRGTGRIVVAA